MLECRSPFYKVCKYLFIQQFNVMKSNEMPISAILSLSYTLKILYTALFIKLFSILNTDLLGSVTSIPYNSAGRQRDLTNMAETRSELDDLDRLYRALKLL